MELERKRYNESAEALARNQEDLRKREVKIASLEKENEAMKKKMADLEEDLRVSDKTWLFLQIFSEILYVEVVIAAWCVVYVDSICRHFPYAWSSLKVEEIQTFTSSNNGF